MLEITMTVLIAITMLLILICHALTVFIRGIISRVFCAVNICLHIALVAFMLVRGIELEWLTLAFMTSLLSYVVMFAVNVKFHTGAEVKEENNDV